MTQAPPASPALNKVLRGNLCSGCGACAALAPKAVKMRMTPPGFLRPDQTAPLPADAEAAIAAACPGLGQTVDAGTRRDDALWGPWIGMQMGHATDPALRHAGASGGALSGLLAHLLASGAVDAVIETAASDAVPVANDTVLARSRDDIRAAAGSRYAPSAPLAALPDALADHRASGRRFAFVGKPCDVAALRAMQTGDPELRTAIPVLLSFFCAGVPSQDGARALLSALDAPEDRLRSFRYRGNGWPGQATAQLDDGSERSMSYHNSWGGILSKHVQHRCKVCADGTGTAADIAFADAWEADARGYPVFSEAPGQSLIVVRSDTGQRLLDEAVAAGAIAVAPFDATTLAAIQPGQRERRRALAARLAALMLAGRPSPRYRGLRLVAAARQNTLRRNAKNFLGMLRRALRARSGGPTKPPR
ncbi:hypothetical protein AL036_14645 [Salipiger aestuarii]|nr:hypothetical protein AL036_14645 [Salipiger aestuarii]